MFSIRLTLLDKFALYIKGAWSATCLLLIILGPLLFFYVGGFRAFHDLQFQYKDVSHATGFVTDYYRIDRIMSNTGTYQHDFTFPIGMETYYGSSYNQVNDLEIDQEVQIEYLKSNPELSRIVGSKASYNTSQGIIGIIFFLIALASVPFRFRWLNRTLESLKNGEVALARFNSLKKTGVIIYDEEEYELSYEYAIGEMSYRITDKTTEPEGKDHDIYVLYSKDDPSDNLPISKFPSMIRRKVAEAINH